MDDVKAAAERRRQWKLWVEGALPADENPYWVNGIKLLVDASKLADAYLTENPADNDEPVTEEWCSASGATQPYGGPYSHRWYWRLKTPSGDSTHVLVSFGDGAEDRRTHLGICGSVVMYNPTRGSVRRLLAVLGIPEAG